MHSKYQVWVWAVPSSISRTTVHGLRGSATALGPLTVNILASKSHTAALSVGFNNRVAARGGCLTSHAANSRSYGSQHNPKPQHHASAQRHAKESGSTSEGQTASKSTSSSSRQGTSSSVGIDQHGSDQHRASLAANGKHRARTPPDSSRNKSSVPLDLEDFKTANLISYPEQPSPTSSHGSTTSSQQDLGSAGSRASQPKQGVHSAATAVSAVPTSVSRASVTDVGDSSSGRSNKAPQGTSGPDAMASSGTNTSDSSSRNRPRLMRAGPRESSRASSSSSYHTASARRLGVSPGKKSVDGSRGLQEARPTAAAAAAAAGGGGGGSGSGLRDLAGSSSSVTNSSRRTAQSRQPQQQQQWVSYSGTRSSSNSRPRDNSSSANGRSSDSQTALAALQQMKHKSFEELWEVAVKYGSTASLTNLMAMFSRLRTVPWTSSRDKAELLQLLWECLEPRLQRASPRHCAEAMLTTSKLQSPLKELYKGCLTAFVRRIRYSDERVLANAVYAVATASDAVSSDGSLKGILEQTMLPEFVKIGSHMHPQAVSNTVYAAALLGVSSDSLDVQQLLQGLRRDFWQTATTQELSNTLWGAAQLGQPLQQPQLRQIVKVLIAKLPESKPVHITNTLWAVAVMGQQLDPKQLQQMMASLLQKPLYARVIASVLWSVGKLGVQISQQQVDQLINVLLDDLTATSMGKLASSSSSSSSVGIRESTVFRKPQAISNALHGVATMRREISHEHLDQLLELLGLELTDCSPQVLSNTLWAVATMKSQVSSRHLDRIYSDLALKLTAAEPQGVANAFWAAGTLIPCYFPSQLLTPEAVHYITEELVPVMKPQELSNIVLACGLLGHSEPLLLGAVLGQTSRLLTTIAHDPAALTLNAQGICNICWGCAVLDMRDYALQLQQLSAHCLPIWSSSGFVAADKVQLYQLHMWLVEQCGHQEGLKDKLGQQRIEACRQAWLLLVGTASVSRVSYTQQTVHEAALQLSELRDVQLEVTTEDQLWSMDICATTVADGRRVAIEVDGPFHYRRPDRNATGSTAFRNKALAYRGYVVVAVPWWEWSEVMHGDLPKKIEYLRRKLQQALRTVDD